MFGRIKSFVPKNFAFQTVLAALLVQALRTLGQKNIGIKKQPPIRNLGNEWEQKQFFVK